MVDTRDLSKIKTAIVLNEMLAELQLKGSVNARITDRKIAIHNSLGKISVETGVTKSTLSGIFAGKSGTKINTIIPILAALNKSFVDFAKRFEKISDSDIQKFKERSTPTRSAPKKRSKK